MVQSQYVIRLADPADAREISAIYRPYVEKSTISFEMEAPGEAEFSARILQSLRRHAWLVCRNDGVVTGYAYAGAHRSRAAYRWAAEVSVYVHEEFQRRKIAHALYTALHEVLKWQGYAIALAGMTLPNKPSEAFHRAMGYVPFARYEDIGFKMGRWHTTEWWRKNLFDRNVTPRDLRTVQSLVHTSDWDDIVHSALRLIRK